jgi:hypothetical protein
VVCILGGKLFQQRQKFYKSLQQTPKGANAQGGKTKMTYCVSQKRSQIKEQQQSNLYYLFNTTSLFYENEY